MMLSQIHTLLSVEQFPSVTIQVPLHVSMPERAQDQARIKSAIQKARELLQEKAPQKTETFIKKLLELESKIDYKQSRLGILLLVNDTLMTLIEIPFSVPEKVSIGSSFELRDVLREAQKMFPYWVLVLSKKPSRLFRGEGNSLHEIREAAVDNLDFPQDGFPFEDLGPADSKSLAIGTGDKDARYKDDHEKTFFRKVDNLFKKFYHDEPFPVIIVGPQRDLSFFEEVTNHKKAIIAKVHGAYNTALAADIAQAVAPSLAEYEQQKIADTLQEFKNAIGRSHQAFGIEWVWRMAQEGRVMRLLVEKNYALQGKIDPKDKFQLILSNQQSTGQEEDIVNRVIDVVIAKQGTIVYVDPGVLKDYQHIAAILRY